MNGSIRPPAARSMPGRRPRPAERRSSRVPSKADGVLLLTRAAFPGPGLAAGDAGISGSGFDPARRGGGLSPRERRPGWRQGTGDHPQRLSGLEGIEHRQGSRHLVGHEVLHQHGAGIARSTTARRRSTRGPKDHVPALAAAYPDVTLRHFTTMTSGYRAMKDEPRGSYRHGPSPTPFDPCNTPLFAPGTQYAYWDSAMNEFGLVLTRIAGEPLERPVQTPNRRPDRHGPQRMEVGRLRPESMASRSTAARATPIIMSSSPPARSPGWGFCFSIVATGTAANSSARSGWRWPRNRRCRRRFRCGPTAGPTVAASTASTGGPTASRPMASGSGPAHPSARTPPAATTTTTCSSFPNGTW